MSGQKEAWEKWYHSNPTHWKGSPLPLPELQAGARVLDVGCGTGNTMIQALEIGYDVVGIDISDVTVDRARERITARGHDAVAISGSIMDPGLDIGRFDCVLLHHVLNNMLLDERMITVQRVIDLLKDDGIISFQDFSKNDIRFGKGREVEKNTFLKGDGIRLHFFDIEETRDLFKDLNLVELEEYKWAHGKAYPILKRSRIKGIFQLPSFSTLGSTSGA
jgi:SAM-dependent methyltransferase